MRYTALFLLLFFTTGTKLSALAQLDDWTKNIQWSFVVEKTDDTHGVLVAKAKLAPGYHVFSVDHDPNKADLTGTPTKLIFQPSKDFKLEGRLTDGRKATKHVDDTGEQLYFEGSATFRQKFVSLTAKPFKMKVAISFQICNEDGCIFPPEPEYEVQVTGMKAADAAVAGEEDNTMASIDSAGPVQPGKTGGTTMQQKKDDFNAIGEVFDSGKKNAKKDTNWVIFIAGFLGGLVALFTPCMFPMIPMTVTFFTKQSKTRSEGIFKALVYGASIIIIYVAFGLIFTAIAGPLGLNDLSTNMWMNIIFFLIFVMFAFSFLGAFEIQLPTSWVNKMDKQADRGGMIGIFFMAFTLGLVSFSCTGPIIGSLLVEAATSGSYWTPAIGMIGFSSALAIPFTLFAIFPGWMNSLPQSGGWLNSVKVVLGLLELALSLKFLSAVDLAYHWDILSREWFVGIWFVLFLIMGIYLLGKLRFAHDSPVEKLSVTRFMFAVLALVFSIYLFPGMFGAPLQVIDGIAPPRTHSEDNFRYVNGGLDTGIEKDSITERFTADMHPVADGSILVFHELDKAREYAKLKDLPVLVDFTGHACQNCRKTESSVWTNDEIRPILQKQIVIVSLYCDDRQELPANEVKYSDAIKGKIKTVGNKWSDLQIRKYKKIAQPLYVISDWKGNDLTEAIGYTPDIAEYRAFLQKGIAAYHKKK
jgi:thiol:disulfide interchange protein DsbD